MLVRSLAIAILVSLCCLASIATACPGKEPVVVLECLRTAFADLNVKAYDALLATDYAFVYPGEAGDTIWKRDKELESTEKMFAEAESAAISFGDDPVVEAHADGTWTIRVRATMQVEFATKDDATVGPTWIQLRVREGESGFQIVEWRDLPTPPQPKSEESN